LKGRPERLVLVQPGGARQTDLKMLVDGGLVFGGQRAADPQVQLQVGGTGVRIWSANQRVHATFSF
jgi:hypothetical protein